MEEISGQIVVKFWGHKKQDFANWLKINNLQSLDEHFLCPGREHFYMFIINVLQNFQAKTQAILERHNFWMIALNKGRKINEKIGDEPIIFSPHLSAHRNNVHSCLSR